MQGQPENNKSLVAQNREFWAASEKRLVKSWDVQTATQALRDAAVARDSQKIRMSAVRLCDAIADRAETMKAIDNSSANDKAPSRHESGIFTNPTKAKQRSCSLPGREDLSCDASSFPERWSVPVTNVAEHQVWSLEIALAKAISAQDTVQIEKLATKVADSLDLQDAIRKEDLQRAAAMPERTKKMPMPNRDQQEALVTETAKRAQENSPTVPAIIEKTSSPDERVCNGKPRPVIEKAQDEWQKTEDAFVKHWVAGTTCLALNDAMASRNAAKISEALERLDEHNHASLAFTARQELRELHVERIQNEFWSPCSTQVPPSVAPRWLPPSPARRRLPLRANTRNIAGLRTQAPFECVYCPCGHPIERVLPSGDHQRICDDCGRPCANRCFTCPRCHHDPPCEQSLSNQSPRPRFCSYTICERCAKRQVEASHAARRRPCSATRKEVSVIVQDAGGTPVVVRVSPHALIIDVIDAVLSHTETATKRVPYTHVFLASEDLKFLPNGSIDFSKLLTLMPHEAIKHHRNFAVNGPRFVQVLPFSSQIPATRNHRVEYVM